MRLLIFFFFTRIVGIFLLISNFIGLNSSTIENAWLKQRDRKMGNRAGILLDMGRFSGCITTGQWDFFLNPVQAGWTETGYPAHGSTESNN